MTALGPSLPVPFIIASVMSAGAVFVNYLANYIRVYPSKVVVGMGGGRKGKLTWATEVTKMREKKKNIRDESSDGPLAMGEI